MFVAIDKDGNRVYIDNAVKSEKYYCPICGSELIVRKGEIKIHHFAHKATTYCDSWVYDMSDWHREWQERFPEECREVVVKHNGEKHRADILINNTVVEFQHSPMSADEFDERNHFYTSAGHSVVWLFDMIDEWDNEKMRYHNHYDDVLIWDYPKKTFSNFEPHLEHNIKLYFQTLDNSIHEGGCGIIPVIWKPEDSMKRFKTKINDCLEEEEFMEIFIPKPEVEIPLSIDDLYDVKYETRTRTSDGCYIDCPLKKNMDYHSCNCCEFRKNYFEEDKVDLYPAACSFRFKDIIIDTNSHISNLVRDPQGFITEIEIIDSTGNKNTIKCPEVPTTTAYSLVEIWDEIQPTVMICTSIRTGNSVKIGKSPAEHLKKYGKVYSYFKKYDWDNFSNNRREIYDALNREWLCTWYRRR